MSVHWQEQFERYADGRATAEEVTALQAALSTSLALIGLSLAGVSQ